MAVARRAEEAPVSTARAALRSLATLAAAAVLMIVYSLTAAWLGAHHAPRGEVAAETVVFFVVLMGIGWAHMRSKSAAECMTSSVASRRYRRRMMIVLGCYLAALLFAVEIRDQLHPTGILAYALALLVAAPVIGAVAAVGLYLREESDEVERALQVESVLWATGAALAIATLWGFLELFAEAPHMQAWLVFTVWALALEAARLLVRRRYR